MTREYGEFLAECLGVCPGDPVAARQAAGFLSSITEEQARQVNEGKAKVVEFADEFGTTQLVCVGMSLDEQHQASREQMNALLSTFDLELARMKPSINAGLAIVERGWQLM